MTRIPLWRLCQLGGCEMTKDKRKYQGKKFINFQCDNLPVETVDEFDTFKEARAMLKEYRLVGGGYYWISQRPTKDWYRG